MGQYNPHAPYIIGNEWVPIRQANFTPDKVTEQGYTFHIDHSVTPITGAYYVAEVPQTRANSVADMVQVYRAGDEALTGPIKQVAIPASAIWVTGTSIDTSDGGYTALLNPSDDKSIFFSGPSDGFTFMGVSFDVPAYSQQLFGKRILDVSFRYSLSATTSTGLEQIGTWLSYAKDVLTYRYVVNFFSLQGTTAGESTIVSSFSVGSTNYLWDGTRDPQFVREAYPWRYQELLRFAATEPASTRMMLVYTNGIQEDANDAHLYYTDMLVTYCEETRILYGGRNTTSSQLGGTASDYEVGPNLVRLFNTSFVSNSTALTAGDYTVTMNHDDWPIDGSSAPKISALRELYPLYPQRGVRIDKSLVPNDTFTIESSPVLPEITLHTTAAVVTGVHPYGVQDAVPVYGTITAIQEIEDDPASTARTYPQVRFYARRFGDTRVPLTLVDVATGLSTVSISVEDFDALEEIVDGWREVNLRFDTPPTFSTAAGDVDWRWQATSELARNQWQVLGAGSRAFAAHSIGLASYYAPQGNTVTLTWQSVPISGTADDTLSDATLLFSTDPPAVSGFAISAESQALTGIAEGCVPGNCIPTAIDYHQLTWTPFGVCDTFEREEVDDWGDADTGQTYTLSGGTTPDNYDVNDGSGKHTLTTTAVARNSTITTGLSLTRARVDVSVSAMATGDSIIAGPAIGTDFDNMYQARLQFLTSGSVVLEIIKRLAGAQASLGSVTVGGYLPDLAWTVEISWRAGGYLSARAWPVGTAEPVYPQQFGIDGSGSMITTFTAVILRSVLNASNSNVNPVVSFDNLSTVTESIRDGSIEIQRFDELAEDWQTIMLSSDPGCLTQFSDYEARVGIASDYRIRTLNALDFAGPWATGSATIPAPGVTIGGTGADGNSVLIFTSNENPDSNLAYVMQFEGQPIETFAFPEADEVQLQRMYGKDFFTVFHPLERGGEQFSRALLVNAAAIPVPSLANFRGLRDLAWESLNYVCVRDELGNRWFANVRVPNGIARMNRTIYMAQVDVTEVTSTPTPIGS